MYKKVYLYAIIMLLISVGAFFLPLSLRVPIIDIITFVTAFIASFAFFLSCHLFKEGLPEVLSHTFIFGFWFVLLGAWRCCMVHPRFTGSRTVPIHSRPLIHIILSSFWYWTSYHPSGEENGEVYGHV